jgi:hypothetical protein
MPWHGPEGWMAQALLCVAFALPVRGIKVMRLAEVSAVLLEHQGAGPFPSFLFRKKHKKNIPGKMPGLEMDALCGRHKVSL